MRPIDILLNLVLLTTLSNIFNSKLHIVYAYSKCASYKMQLGSFEQLDNGQYKWECK